MSFFKTAAGIASPFNGYRCLGCKTEKRLADLNDDMLCCECGEPTEDPEDFIDTSDAAMLREHGTWRL